MLYVLFGLMEIEKEEIVRREIEEKYVISFLVFIYKIIKWAELKFLGFTINFTPF